jgi:glutamate racemase
MIYRAGIFDSGVGGLTVAKSIYQAKLFDEIIYFGDTARVPYGSKNESTIIRYSLEAVEFLKNFDINFLITACNSVSSCALPHIEKEVNFEVVGVIEAGVRAVVKLASKNDNILVIGTKTTIHSNFYQSELLKNGFNKVTAIPTPLLVPIVEEELFEPKIVFTIFEHYFKELEREKIDVVVLGCTHFPILADYLKEYFNNAKLVHSGDAIVEFLKENYNLKSKQTETKVQFLASENPAHLKRVAKKWLNLRSE